MKTQHKCTTLEGFYFQAVVSFSTEIFTEMSYWPQSMEMTVDSHVGGDLGAVEVRDCSKKKDQGQ